MTEYWLAVVDELSDQTGVTFPDDKREIAAEILRSAASVRGEYSAHSEPARPTFVQPQTAERKLAWWEDVSRLSGSDWVLARRIHSLIDSRHA